MARRMVGDDQGVYRVVVVRRERRDNPDWQRGVTGPGNPRFCWDGPEHSYTYGPYNSIGAARGQLTCHTVDAYGGNLNGVIGGKIQKATTTWEDVE